MAEPRDDRGRYISARYLRGLFDHLRAHSIELQPVLDVIGLSEAQLQDPDRHIPHALQDAIFAAAERVSGDSNVGLHAGEHTHVMHFGIVGQLALTCATGGELLDLHVRYQSLIGNGLRSVLVEQGDALVLQFEASRQAQKARHSIEYTMAAQLNLARLLAGPVFVPRLIEMVYAEPLHSSEQARVLGCELRYGCDRMRTHFAASLRTLPLPGRDQDVRRALEAEARRRLLELRVPVQHKEPFVAKLEQYVADRLSTGAPSAEDAARTLGISVRSLQRKLEPHGLAYRDVVELARREVAERLMSDESLSLLDIALLLGFADQTAFHRAFRRWFDATPGDYRARARQLDTR